MKDYECQVDIFDFMPDEPQPEKIMNPMIRIYGTGPQGTKCKTCEFLCWIQPGQNIYYKCEMRGVTHGPGTDHRVNWQSCGKYKEDEHESS